MIYFIQPAVPKYRVPFFNALAASKKFPDFEVHCSQNDMAGVITWNKDVKYCQHSSSSGFSGLCGVYWQKSIKLPPLNKEDILVISGNPRVLSSMIVFLSCKIRGIKTIWWGQGWTAGSYGLMAKIRRRLMLFANAVVLYTDEEASSFKGKKHVYGINNGIDINPIIKQSNDVRIAKTEQEPLKLLFIGRLTAKSNIQYLIEALILVNRPIVLEVIGDGKVKDSLAELLDKSNKSCKVHWHGALFKEVDIAKIALSCHAFIYPGAVGLSLIHAFAYALPAIIHNTKNEHMPEFAAFKEGVNGITFEKSHITSLVNLLECTELDKLEQMGNNAFKMVLETYNTDDMAVRFEKVVRELNKHD